MTFKSLMYGSYTSKFKHISSSQIKDNYKVEFLSL